MLAVWVPRSLHAFLEDYLQRNCQGDSFSAGFKVFLYDFKALDDKGEAVVNPIKRYEANRREMFKTQFGVDPPNNLCLYCKDAFQKQDDKGKALFCQYCKDKNRTEYKACQELKAELLAELKKDGLS